MMEALMNGRVSFPLSPWIAGSTCFGLSAAFVGSLYVWTLPPFSFLRSGQHPSCKGLSFHRDHPVVIFRRSLSILFVCIASPPAVALLACPDPERGQTFWRLLGVRLDGLVPAMALPFALTHILFLGSHFLNHLEGMNSLYSEPRFWLECARSPIWMRNHVVAPFAEEFVFRSCMVPLLVPWIGPGLTLVVAPLFFGLAHFHHIYEKRTTTGLPLSQILPASCFQFLYTSVYGAYSVFLFLRTGHIAAPVIAHAVCNHMGFPNFGDVFVYGGRTQVALLASFVVGAVAWAALLYPLTDPSIFGNEIWTGL